MLECLSHRDERKDKGDMIKDRIWICEECNRIITEEEKNKDEAEKKWGHKCKMHPRSIKEYRCEAYWQPYIPEP